MINFLQTTNTMLKFLNNWFHRRHESGKRTPDFHQLSQFNPLTVDGAQGESGKWRKYLLAKFLVERIWKIMISWNECCNTDEYPPAVAFIWMIALRKSQWKLYQDVFSFRSFWLHTINFLQKTNTMLKFLNNWFQIRQESSLVTG